MKKSNIEIGYTQDQLLELYRCSQDPIYFIENYIKVRHPKYGQIPLKLYDYQKEMLKLYHKRRFVVALSARQTRKDNRFNGFSTLVFHISPR